MIYYITMKNNSLYVLNLKPYLWNNKQPKEINLNAVLKESFAIDSKKIAKMVVKY